MGVRSWWEEQALPRLVDVALADATAGTWRTSVCGGATGDVLEIGFASGRNLPYYPASVTSVLAVEPADLAWHRATARVTASRMPVTRVGLDGADLPVADASVDTVVSTWTLCTVPEVERALTDHPAVLDAAVFGIPDEKWGESVKAVVELSGGQQTSSEELVAWCREKLAHYKCPRSVDIMVELPRNPTGKLLKKDLRKPYWENRDRAI